MGWGFFKGALSEPHPAEPIWFNVALGWVFLSQHTPPLRRGRLLVYRGPMGVAPCYLVRMARSPFAFAVVFLNLCLYYTTSFGSCQAFFSIFSNFFWGMPAASASQRPPIYIPRVRAAALATLVRMARSPFRLRGGILGSSRIPCAWWWGAPVPSPLEHL